MAAKHNNERKIFDFVYGNKALISLTPTDKPDFCASIETGLKFGVEVTELFKNDSDARLRHIPNYLSDLLDKKEVRHKDDKKNLVVDEVILINEDGENIPIDAIIQIQPTINNYLQNINNRILDKNKKYEDYENNLNHINLIVCDSSGVYSIVEHREFYNLFFRGAIKSTVYNSKFREIYYVTTIKNNKKYVFPLKRMLLLSTIYLFQEVLIRASLNDLTDENYYCRLYEFLIYKGASGIGIHESHDGYELIFGNTGYKLKDEKQIILQDYSDLRTPTFNSFVLKGPGFIDAQIQNIISEIEEDFGFESELGLSINN